MAHDSRCADADTSVGSCDCECDGRLHGIGDENSDHQTAQITEHEQRIDEEFMQRFQPEDDQRLRQNADMAAFEQFVEEKPELADMLQEAEDDPDLDFEVGDIYWEKNANGDRMNVIVPGIDDADKDRREKIRDAADEYMERKKAKQYEEMGNRLRELDRVTNNEYEFPEMEHIHSTIEDVGSDEPPTSPSEEVYNAEQQFGDLKTKRRYFIHYPEEPQAETAEEEEPVSLTVQTRHYKNGKEVRNTELPSTTDVNLEKYDIEGGKIGNETIEEFVKANHNADPQADFRVFGD